MTVTLHGDYVAKGVGLADGNEGTIVIDTIPDDARLVGGILYWAFEDRETQLVHRRITINGTLLLEGELTGQLKYSSAYRTLISRDKLLNPGVDPAGGPLPPAPSGNGTYVISVDPGLEPAVAQGATLVLVYEHEAVPARDVVFNDGNVRPPVNPPPPWVYHARIAVGGFTVGPPAEGRCTFIVGDGCPRGRDQMLYQTELLRHRYGPGFPFDSTEGNYWDTETMSLDGLLTTGESKGWAIVRVLATLVPGGLVAVDDLIWVAHVMSVTTSSPVHPDPASLFH
jgi:hypothetical protein